MGLPLRLGSRDCRGALNDMLVAEADRLCGAARHESSDAQQDTRTGHYERSLDTKAGPISLRTRFSKDLVLNKL